MNNARFSVNAESIVDTAQTGRLADYLHADYAFDELLTSVGAIRMQPRPYSHCMCIAVASGMPSGNRAIGVLGRVARVLSSTE